ncbi:phage tail sheath family protein [Enterobacter ludwigii]|uniref:phage tail sheath family protein n=1 Tax=Enterobacter ludwigii TaxID=299767 RepID=UPI003F72929D
MTVNVSYPGVYLSELKDSDVAINSSEGIVPLFVSFGAKYPANPGVLCFNNLQEVDAQNGVKTNNIYYHSLYSWFKLGGGRCYLARTDAIKSAVQRYDEINLIVAAGYAGETQKYFNSQSVLDDQSPIINAVNELADSGKTYFLLLDGKQNKMEVDDSLEKIIPGICVTPHAAVFYPWCQLDYPFPDGKLFPVLAPSVVAALAIAKTDRTRGVWKAPCNVPVSGFTPNFPVSDAFQEHFNNNMAINMIRTFPETGTVLWGARTLEDSENWRYIPVRRLFNKVETDIKTSLSKLVFEPNSQPTWQRVKAAVDNYLYELWQQGALVGNKQEDAWFTEIGKDITMTEDEIKQGKMVIKIGLAAVRPAEFIILQFSQDVSQ